ncbi:hypothetical protein [Halobacteriovorax sp. JY17]|uniref:hypothetical protein n=1 Tax=Halobacteriovorax sp. JY17 TaxID=2014617 RepID=UPI000C60660A|nr:hypothetical protein [Halobacteriovorax sp. JY17]PIK15491.1 MAG: hypothetical protein CES88_01865 [Halobacteriovorax sp. JY17]
MITLTNIKGHTFKFTNLNQKVEKIDIQTPLYANEIVTTDSKGMAVIDFNDEVIGTVILAPNTQVILRKSTTDGIRLLSLVRGHLRLYRDKEYQKKKVGVLINIRDNPTAYYGSNFEVQYSKESKKVTSFNKSLRKFKLNKKKILTTPLKNEEKTDELDQELYEDLKFLQEST